MLSELLDTDHPSGQVQDVTLDDEVVVHTDTDALLGAEDMTDCPDLSCDDPDCRTKRRKRQPRLSHKKDELPVLLKEDALKLLPPRYVAPDVVLKADFPVSVEWFASVTIQLLADGIQAEPLLQLLADWQKLTELDAEEMEELLVYVQPLLDLLRAETGLQSTLSDTATRMKAIIDTPEIREDVLEEQVSELGGQVEDVVRAATARVAHLKFSLPASLPIDSAHDPSADEPISTQLMLMDRSLLALDRVVTKDPTQRMVLRPDPRIEMLGSMDAAEAQDDLERVVKTAPEFEPVTGDAMKIAMALVAIEGRLMGSFDAEEARIAVEEAVSD